MTFCLLLWQHVKKMVKFILCRWLRWLSPKHYQRVPYLPSLNHVSRHSHNVGICQPHEVFEIRQEERSRHSNNQNSQQTQASVNWRYPCLKSLKIHPPSSQNRKWLCRIFRITVRWGTSSSWKTCIPCAFLISRGSMAYFEEHNWLVQTRRTQKNSIYISISSI